MLRPRLVQIFRWERDGSVTVVGTWGDGPNPFPAGSNWPWDDPSLVAMMEQLRTGEPVRIEDVAEVARGRARGRGPRAWGSFRPPARRSSSTARRGATSASRWRRVCRCPTASRNGLRSSPSWSRRRSPAARPASSSPGSPTSRPRYGASRPSSPAARRPPTSSTRSRRSWGGSSTPRSSGLVRFEDENTARVVAGWGRLGEVVPVGARLPIGGMNVITQIARSGRPARIDDFDAQATGPIGDQARRLNTAHRGRRPDPGRRPALGRHGRGGPDGDPMPPTPSRGSSSSPS